MGGSKLIFSPNGIISVTGEDNGSRISSKRAAIAAPRCALPPRLAHHCAARCCAAPYRRAARACAAPRFIALP